MAAAGRNGSDAPPGRGDRSLQRFVAAQSTVYEQALHELQRGEKTGHWMWFIFPQIAGLGSSSMAHRYAIADLDEARRYLDHPLLGARLIECTRLVNGHADKPLDNILPYPDNLKFRSSMTLFARTPGADPAFAEALRLFCAGEADPATLGKLAI